jgi:hypothetical protein
MKAIEGCVIDYDASRTIGSGLDRLTIRLDNGEHVYLSQEDDDWYMVTHVTSNGVIQWKAEFANAPVPAIAAAILVSREMAEVAA